MNIEELAIGIPTKNDRVEDIRIGYVIQAIAFQADVVPMHIYIWDEGKVPITAHRWTRMIIDMASAMGVQTTLLRRTPSHGVGAARRGLFNEIFPLFRYILLIDDDLIPAPGSIKLLVDEGNLFNTWGFLQGSKIEVDQTREYPNDINTQVAPSQGKLQRIYFGDTAFLLLNRRKVDDHVNWDRVTYHGQEGIPGEDILLSLMLSDKVPCYAVPGANGYHITLEQVRWHWAASGDILRINELKDVVGKGTLKKALPHLADYIEKLYRATR